MSQPRIHATTILSVRRGDQIAIGGDGQVTIANTALKPDAVKIRKLAGGKVLCGFAGAAADAFSLLERFEAKLDQYKQNTKRAAIELAKDWRTDRVLRRLESLLAVVDAETSLIIGGNGDIIEPSDGVIGIGSGGMFAAAAAKALLRHSNLPAREIVEHALRVAAEICIYTNDRITVETLNAE
jgi:ATP-dependent HslUV protease subunit HslV